YPEPYPAGAQPAALTVSEGTPDTGRDMEQDMNMLALGWSAFPHPEIGQGFASQAQPVRRQLQKAQCRPLIVRPQSRPFPMYGGEAIRRLADSRREGCRRYKVFRLR